MILASRVLNNLLVNDVAVTGRIMKEITMSQVVKFCGQMRGQDSVRFEIAGIFMNLLHFMNDDELLVRSMVGFGVPELIISCF